MDRKGIWRLSPAYDMTYIFDTGGFLPNREHCLMIGGKIQDICREDVLSFAAECGIRMPDNIIRKVASAVQKFRELAEKNGVRVEWIGRVETTIVNHLKSWGLWDGQSQASSLTVDGHHVTDFHLEQQFKGNYLLLAAIDGNGLKYIIRKGTPEHDLLTKTGLANVSNEMKKELIVRFLLPKVSGNL